MHVLLALGCICHFLVMSLRLALAGALDTDSQAPEELNNQPSFIPRNSHVRVHRGDTAVLVCGIENLGTKMVIWRRASDPNPLTIGEDVYVGDPRLSAYGRPEKKEWLLVISDVRKSDSGVYECQISSRHKLINHILLRVNATANPQRKNYVNFKKDKTHPIVEKSPGIFVTGTKYVEKGDPIHLRCNSTGRVASPDNLDWFKDGVKLLPSGLRQVKIDKYHLANSYTLMSSLHIRHSRMEDAGTYVCRSSDLSINSTKVHVLNAGSTNVRRGTSATDEAQKPETEQETMKDGTQQQQQRPPRSGGPSNMAASKLRGPSLTLLAAFNGVLSYLLTQRLHCHYCR